MFLTSDLFLFLVYFAHPRGRELPYGRYANLVGVPQERGPRRVSFQHPQSSSDLHRIWQISVLGSKFPTSGYQVQDETTAQMSFLACLEMCSTMEGILPCFHLSTKCHNQGMASCSDHWRWPRWSVNLDSGWIAVVQCHLSSHIDIVSIFDRFQNASHVCYVPWSTWIPNVTKLVWKPCRLSLDFGNASGWQDASWLTWSWESQNGAKSFHLCLCLERLYRPHWSWKKTHNLWQLFINWSVVFCVESISSMDSYVLKPSCGAAVPVALPRPGTWIARATQALQVRRRHENRNELERKT